MNFIISRSLRKASSDTHLEMIYLFLLKLFMLIGKYSSFIDNILSYVVKKTPLPHETLLPFDY